MTVGRGSSKEGDNQRAPGMRGQYGVITGYVPPSSGLGCNHHSTSEWGWLRDSDFLALASQSEGIASCRQRATRWCVWGPQRHQGMCARVYSTLHTLRTQITNSSKSTSPNPNSSNGSSNNKLRQHLMMQEDIDRVCI